MGHISSGDNIEFPGVLSTNFKKLVFSRCALRIFIPIPLFQARDQMQQKVKDPAHNNT
jgi:hypothetical protein